MNAKAAPLRIACLGECMIELSDLAADDGRARLGVAGDTLNTAVYLARCLPPETATVSYLTALGTDQLSDRMMAFMAEQRIDTSAIARLADRLPGIYAIELDARGERSFLYWRGQSAARSMLRPGALDLSVLDSFDLIYLSGISLAILPPEDRAGLLAKLGDRKTAGCTVVFDSNYRPKLWGDAETARTTMSEAWSVSTIGLPSLDDEVALSGAAEGREVLARIAGFGVSEIALKRGAEGPLLCHKDEVIEGDYPPCPAVRDTTAAGDSFNAGYLAGRITGSAPRAAAQAGHKLAMCVIEQIGAIVDVEPWDL